MLCRIRSILVLTLAAGLMWHCGGERVTQSQPETTGPPLGKLTARGHASQAVVRVNLSQDGAPVSGAKVEFSRAIAGRAASYQWSGMTDENGQARVEIAADNVTGYYRARAMQDGSEIDSWSSIPINAGYQVMLNLPIGGKARATGSSKMLMGEISIGVITSLTGPLASVSTMRNGIELAREEINRSTQLGEASLRFIIEDDQSSVAGATTVYDKLINRDGVSIIIGPFTSSMTQAIFPRAQANEVVAISPTSAASGLSALGDYVFRASLTVDRLLPSGVATTQKALGYRQVATLYDSDDVFSQSSDAVLKEAFMANGVEVLTTETFQTGDTDFSAQLTRIKEMNPDAIFISALPTEATNILIQGRQLGIPAEVPFLTSLTLTAGEIQRAGDAAEGAVAFTAWSSTADTPGNRAFVENYRAKFGSEPDVFAAQSHATVHLLAKALADAQSTEASAIRDALARIEEFDTVLGQFSFDANGDGVYDPAVLIVKDGKLEAFKPSPSAIAIGLVPHLTGPLAETELQNAAELALAEIDKLHADARLEFIVEDSRSTPAGAIAAYDKLIAQGVQVILGPRTSTVFREALAVAQENGVVAISPTSAARGLSAMGDYVFRTSLTVDRLIPSGVQATRAALGYRRVATVFDSTDAYSRSSDEVLKEVFMDNGVEVLTTATLQSGDTDFSAQWQKIKDLNPDAVFISTQEREMASVLMQGRQQGIPSTVRFIVPLILTPDVIQRAGAAAEDVIVFAAWSSMAATPGNRAFVENYSAKYDREPSVFAAQSYAAMHILARAIATASSTDASAIRDALATTMDLDTVLGQFSFDANGDGIYAPTILIVKNGAFEVFGM